MYVRACARARTRVSIAGANVRNVRHVRQTCNREVSMGLKHEAKPGTTITANGIKVIVLRGSPLLEVTADPDVAITTGQIERQQSGKQQHRSRICRPPKENNPGIKQWRERR